MKNLKSFESYFSAEPAVKPTTKPTVIPKRPSPMPTTRPSVEPRPKASIMSELKEHIGYKLYEKISNDDIGDFYVVLIPTKTSTLADIFFKSDIKYLLNQFRGGLTEEEVYGFYKDKKEAETVAKTLLKNKTKK